MPTHIDQTDEKFEAAWQIVQSLASDFIANQDFFFSQDYQEAHVREDFLNKLFFAIGWKRSSDPFCQEMKIEKPEKKANGRADYAFCLAPHYDRVRFFVEAKRPHQHIDTHDNCFQAIRYSRPKGLPITILTDFNNTYVIDSRFRPNIDSAKSRIVKQWNCRDYFDRDKFAEFYWLLSREGVARGNIERFTEIYLPDVKTATRQYSLFANETKDFDDDFLEKLDEWRSTLASVFKQANTSLSGEQLTEAVQKTLDRLIFIRFLEDKGIEPESIILKFGQNKRRHWDDFIKVSRQLDVVYNGIVFKPNSVLEKREFQPDGTEFANICDELTDNHSPYKFDAIPIEILGRIYERFLGKIVQTTQKEVDVVEKESVRKAGGVYYTPDYIVSYMIRQSLGKIVENKNPNEILKLKIIDTSCGSGSFLIAIFGFLLNYIGTYYSKYPNEAKKGMLELRDDIYHLTLSYKREILLSCIYGVDIDPQAVEVAQLSLYLKLMEDETTYSASQQRQQEIGVALLPSLSSNIIVGNSVVTLTDNGGEDMFLLEKLRETKSLDFKAAFPKVFAQGGFDLVIGNPPYIKEPTNRNAFDHIRSSPYYEGKMDIWYMFACRGIDWLKPEGYLAFIATNNWVTNSGAKQLRSKITTDTSIKQLIDFGDYKVFKDAGIQTMILIAIKTKVSESYKFDYRRMNGLNHTLSDVNDLLEGKQKLNLEYLQPTFDRNRIPTSLLTFSNNSIETLLDKMKLKRNFILDGKSEVAQGIVTPQDYLNRKGQEKLGNKFSIGQGIFILSEVERSDLKLSIDESSIVKPFFTSSELKRYACISTNNYSVIYTNSSFSKPNSMDNYPVLKRHLDKFLEIITSSNAPYGLHRARNEYFFTGEKIISLRKCSGKQCFTYTEFPCYVSQSHNIIKSNRINLLFLTGLLNSKLIKFWLKHRGKMQGQNFQIDKEPLLEIPLCVPSNSEQEDVAKLVAKLIKCLKQLPSASTDSDKQYIERLISQLESEIQIKISNIYELNSDDLLLIDGD